jgi:hypothetical protein
VELSSKYDHIKGWGADLDPADRPAYPKERTPPRLHNLHWDQPQPQPQHIEVLVSSEYEARPPLFGTGPAPGGLSGLIRRYAFGFSENDLRHWLLLLFADRVDVGEGIVSDLRSGHVPRIYSEMGGRAELTHNPAGAARKAAMLGAVLGLGYLALRRKGRSKLPR